MATHSSDQRTDHLVTFIDMPKTIDVWYIPSGTLPRQSSPIPLLNELFRDGGCSYLVIDIQPGVEHPLVIWYSPASCLLGSPINNSILGLFHGRFPNLPWPGPVVVMRFSGCEKRDFTSVRASDILPLIRYFWSYGP
ncbi:hypothetical protein LXA43DRAFT_901272 [Ganoderma leucocontextum]|nr:hypothetical protein LXA43DRAFT_901272 [Ganoderma leucocontextum]